MNTPEPVTPVEQPKTKTLGMTNTTAATAVGLGGGSVGSVVISWLAAEGERRYGIPFAVTAAVLGGPGAALVARWAAKLMPS